MKKQKYIAFSTEEDRREFVEGDLTIQEFEDYIIRKFKKTTSGKLITRKYIYSLLSYGHLPKAMGGNRLFISKVRGLISVRVLEEKHSFNINSGRSTPGQKKRGPKK